MHGATMPKMKVLSSAALIKLVEAAGWVLDRTSGSHHVFVHPDRAGIVVIPHPRKSMKRGTQRSIMKQAGLL